MTATFNKCYGWVNALHQGSINMGSDSIKMTLSSVATVSTNTSYADISANEVANGNGYTTGGTSISAPTTNSQTNGTYTLAASQVVFTSATANMGTFRYVTGYDSTPGAKPLMGWWDYGSTIVLQGANGDTFTIQFNSGNPGTIYTLA